MHLRDSLAEAGPAQRRDFGRRSGVDATGLWGAGSPFTLDLDLERPPMSLDYVYFSGIGRCFKTSAPHPGLDKSNPWRAQHAMRIRHYK